MLLLLAARKRRTRGGCRRSRVRRSSICAFPIFCCGRPFLELLRHPRPKGSRLEYSGERFRNSRILCRRFRNARGLPGALTSVQEVESQEYFHQSGGTSLSRGGTIHPSLGQLFCSGRWPARLWVGTMVVRGGSRRAYLERRWPMTSRTDRRGADK